MQKGIFRGLQSTGKWVVIGIAGIVLAGLFAVSVMTRATMDIEEHTYFLTDGLVYRLGVVALCVAAILALRKWRVRAPGKRTLIVLTGMFVAGAAAYVWLLALNPRADQSHVLRCASWLAQGNYAQWDKGGYLYIYPHQNALVLAFYAVYRVFGENSWLAIQFINIPLFVFSAFCLADNAHMLFGSPALGAWTYAALLLFFPLAMYVTFVYGTLVGLTLSLAGLWLMVRALKGGRILSGFLGAALLALSALLRVNFLVSIIAFSIALLFYALRARTLRPVAFVAAVLVCFVAGRALVSTTMERMTGRPTNEGSPALAWIAMGFQDSKRAAGWYNRYNLETYMDNDYDEAATRAESLTSIRHSLGRFLRDPGETASFFFCKIASQWSDGTFEGLGITQNRNSNRPVSRWMRSLLNENGPLFLILTRVGDMLLPAIWLGALLFLAYGFRRHDVFSLVFVIAFIGGFLFSLIWEAKSQYVVVYVYMMIPCALRGYQLAATQPMRKALPLGAPMAALACCFAALVVFALPAKQQQERYAALRWRLAGGDVPAGTYEVALADGRMLALDGGRLVLKPDNGTAFTYEYGIFYADGMALEVTGELDRKAGSAVNPDQAGISRLVQRWYTAEAENGGYYIQFGKSLALTCEPDGSFALEGLAGGDDQTWYFSRMED